MKYPGGKNHGSSYPRIINQIPPHELYIEPFAGSAAIRRMMRPCRQSILVDLDPGALGRLAELVPPGTELLKANGLDWLMYDRLCLEKNMPPTVVYCDPPYLASSCASRLRYKHVLSDGDHTRLLCRLKQLRCYVLISGYWSGLYANLLNDWRLIHWPQITRGGTWAEECLWMNFPQPVELHDYRYLGEGFRERQDIRRMQQRWSRKLAAMTTLKRQALLSVLADLKGPGPIGSNAAEISADQGTSAAMPRRTQAGTPKAGRPAAELPIQASSGGTAEAGRARRKSRGSTRA